MAARPQTTRATPIQSRCCGAAVGSRRPLALQPRGARPATCCVGACPWPAHAGHSWPMVTIPTASLPSQPSANKLAYPTNRDGVAERCAAPAVHTSLAVARALITSYDARWRDVARTIGNTATRHDAHPLYLRHTVPGIGTSLRRVLLYAIPQIDRFPRGQDCASSCRRGTGATASAGKRSGASGTTIGHAPLTGAFSAAAVFCLREHPAGQTCLTRLEKKQSKGKALTL